MGIRSLSSENIDGSVVISNNEFYKAESTSGTDYKIAGLTSGNMIQIGAIDYTSAGTIFAGGDNISITTGGASGTTRIKINSSGNVGMGTSSPNHKLDIYSNENIPLRIHRPSNSNLNSAGAHGIGFSTRSDAITSTTDTRSGIFSYYNGNLFFATNTSNIESDPDGSARMTILNTGYVGINTTNPLNQFDVRGAVYVTGYTIGFDTSPQGNYAYRFTNDGGNSFINAQGGSLGVDTTSPVSKLEVQSSLNSTNFTGITVTNTEGSGSNLSRAGIAFKAYDWVQSAIWHGRNMSDGNQGALVLGTNPDTSDLTVGGVVGRMYIINNGNVGIGTPSPSDLLHLKKSSGDAALRIETVTGGDPTIIFNSSAANRSGMIKYQDNGTNMGRIEYVHNGDRIAFQAGSATGETMSIKNGAVGIGTTSPTAKLDISGMGSGGVGIRIKDAQNVAGNYYYGFMFDGTDVRGLTQSNIFYAGGSVNANTTIATWASMRIDTPYLNSGASVTHNFGIYQSSALQKNYFAGNVGIAIDTPQAKLQVNGAVDTFSAHFGGQNNTNGQFQGISLGYAEATNAAYRKVGIVAQAKGDGAARQDLHFLVDTVADSNSAGIADSKMHIEYDTGNVVIAKNLGIGGRPPDSSWGSDSDIIQFGAGDNDEGFIGWRAIAGADELNMGWNCYNDNSNWKYDSGNPAGLYQQKNGSHTFYGAASGSADANITWHDQMYIDTGGDVGIGDTSPGTALQAFGSASKGLSIANQQPTIAFTDTDTGSRRAYIAYEGGSHQFYLSSPESNGIMTFQTGGFNERMRITSAGNVGIGTNAPSVPLQVNGQQKWHTTNADGNELRGFFNPGGAADDAEFSVYKADGATEGVVWRGTGNSYIRIDSTSLKFINFYYGPSNVGQIVTGGSNVLYQSNSDYRLKENVVEMTGALDRVSQLKPSRYNFISNPEEQVDGFMAHELQEVVPQAVSGQKDEMNEDGTPKYQGVDHSQIVPLLVGAIKELKAEIENLKSQIQ